MFDLVADVERYPEFVPLCRALKVRRRLSGPEGVEVVIADMTVAYKLVRETFTSRVTLDRPNLQILVEYVEGPFSKLENRWVFHAVGDHLCDIEFFIAYDFRSRTLGLLMGTVFDAAFRRFAAAFEKRADAIYGRRQDLGGR
jgi:coenzyme Q-binding protein COQ10